MSTVTDLTVSEMILLAALDLEERGQSPFTAEVLVVAAWQKFPRAFGLKGFTEQYPDSNKVLASIMGRRGLIHRHWLTKIGQKVYSLTPEGRLAAGALLDGRSPPPPSTPEAVKFSREQEKLLLDLLGSSAWRKFHENNRNDLSFADACRFWDITDNLHGTALDARLKRLPDNLAALQRLLGTARTSLSNGRSIEPDDLNQLCQLHAYLEKRFSRLLNLLRNRSERN